jgi:nucleoside-triphosphatase THEP1
MNLNPAALLTQLLAGALTTQTIVITGESGSGKSTLCKELIDEAHKRGLTAGGVLSPPVFDGPQKVGIDLEDVATGERRRLARLRPQVLENAPTRKWAFDEIVLEWGNQLLRTTPYCDVLVIDELGPLEFKHRQGLLEGLVIVERRSFRLGFVVVRPLLLADARQLWMVDAVVDCTPGRQSLQ